MEISVGIPRGDERGNWNLVLMAALFNGHEKIW